jgi:hypothetical protein
MSQGTDGWAECTSKTEIGQLQSSIPRHQKILWFKITVHDSSSVTESKATTHLEEIRFDKHRVKHSRASLHVLFKVAIKELENKIKLSITLDTVFQLHNIVMAKLSEQTNFT